MIGLVLMGIAVVGAALVTAALLAPLFRWQTAAVALVIDQYQIGVVEPVPFATEDRAGLAQGLAGLLNTGLGKDVVDLTGMESAAGLRELLLPRMLQLPLRSKDVMIAYIRGQTIVAPTVGTAGLDPSDPFTGRACFLASDLEISGQRPQELVPVREIVEAIGAAAPYVTLHAVDLGDISWDPRLGALVGCVPLALDTDFAAPQRDARYHNWVIGSHDAFQQSGVSLPGGRSYFGRALELALSGGADQAPAGDGDGLVELHEVVEFVKSWTSEWVRRASGGRVVQTPVVWKLGVGRVAAADVPKDVPLIRLSERKQASPPATAATAASGKESSGTGKEVAAAGSPGPATADQPAEPAPPPTSPPAPPPAPGAQPSPARPDAPAAAEKSGGQAAAQGGDQTGGGTDAKAAESPPPAGGTTPASGTEAASPPAQTSKPSGGDPGAAAAGAAPAPALTTAAQEAGGGAAAPQPPAGGAAGQAAPPIRPQDAWEALDFFGDRRRPIPGLTASPDGLLSPVPIDYVPHLWSRAYALVASADVRRHSVGPLRERSEVAFARYGRELGDLWVDYASAGATAGPRGGRAADSLVQGVAAIASGREFGSRWSAAPPAYTRALAARDDAVIAVASTIDVTSRLSGGAGTLPIEPTRIGTLVNKVALLTAAIRRFHTASDDSPVDAQDVRLLETATRTTAAETAILLELLESLSGTNATTTSGVLQRNCFPSMLAVVRSPAISPRLRDEIRAAMLPPPAGEASPPLADGSPPPIFETTSTLDPQALDNIAARVLDVVTLVEANVAGGGDDDLRNEFGGLTADIAAVRLAATQLGEAAADQRQALDRIVLLGGHITQVYARIAQLARAVREGEESGRVSIAGAPAGLLRVIDSRDVAMLDRAISASMPPFQQRVRRQIGLSVAGGDLAVDVPLDGLLTVLGGKGMPEDARLRFDFDPADVELIVPGGREVDAGIPIRVAGLQLVEKAVPLRIRARRDRSGAGDLAEAVVRVRIESVGLSAEEEFRFTLPARRGLAVAARRAPAELGRAAAAWRFAESLGRSPLPPAGGRAMQADRARLELVAVPGMTSSWEFALDNPAEIPRTFSVRLYELPAPTPLNSQSGRTRSDVWTEFCDRLEAGDTLPKPLESADKVTVAARSGPTPLVFAPAEPAPAPAAPAAAEKPAAPDKPAEKRVSELAMVVTETTPGEPTRTFAVRLSPSVEHPRNRVQASAVWDPDERLIAVQVAPAATADAASLPAAGLQVEMEPLPPGLGAERQPVVLRRSATVLTSRRPNDTLTAVWQGSDLDARAELAVSVNGYPRAFVFRVDCSPAAAGVAQGPQEDFRGIAFAGPRPVVDPLVRAPAASVPINLLVDAPPDIAAARAVSAAGQPVASLGPVVSLAFRGLRGGMIADAAQQVWSASGDREVVFTLDKPVPPAALAIATRVSDWSVAPTGEGYVDLDLEAEAALAVPGTRSLLKATRVFVMDARPPTVEVPPLVNATIGRPLTVPVVAFDDPRETLADQPGRHIPGVSGVAKVEWALDLKGDGNPEAWTPAVGLGGGRYEVRVETAKLPAGVRTPLLVRASDRVGLANPPSRTWIDTAVKPAKGSITGRVTLKGHGEADVTVRIDGPNAPPPARSGRDGTFSFTDLDPGSYTLKATGPVRNRTYSSEATPATVAAPPAPTATVTLELK